MEEKYALYISKQKKIPKSAEYSFYNSRKDHLLVFTNKKPGKGFYPVPESLSDRLSEEEKEWLFQSKVKVHKKHIASHEDYYLDLFQRFMDQLKVELEIEKQKAEGGSNNGN